MRESPKLFKNREKIFDSAIHICSPIENEVRFPMFHMIINDWNHLFSNIFYVCSGVCFIFAVSERKKRRSDEMVNLYVEDMSKRKCLKDNLIEKFFRDLLGKKTVFEERKEEFLKTVKREKLSVEYLNQCGVPEQYGIFYAMGAATIIEGILSSCYHICPTHESFQFDTTFIYIIAILISSKMYQFRHPDQTIRAHNIFSVICFVVFFETLSYYLPITTYICLFVLTYLILLGWIFYLSGWYDIVVTECMSVYNNWKQMGKLDAKKQKNL